MLEGEPVGVLRKKNFNNPDEIQDSDLCQAKILAVGDTIFTRKNLKPGWRGSEICEGSHIHLQMTGRMGIRTNDGIETTLRPGDAVITPDIYESWVIGRKRATILEVTPPGQRILLRTTTEDDAALRTVGHDLIAAINAHDAAAITNLFDDHADFVTARGKFIHGQEDIGRYFNVYLHELLPAERIFRISDVRTLIITNTVSDINVYWSLASADNPARLIPHNAGLMHMIAVKDISRWRILRAYSIDLMEAAEQK